MKTDNSTPRPWKTHCQFIRASDSIVADCAKSKNADADAALIVQAVNEHAALVAVAEAAERALNYLADLNGSQWFANPDHYATKDIKQRAKGLQQLLWDSKANLAAVRKQ